MALTSNTTSASRQIATAASAMPSLEPIASPAACVRMASAKIHMEIALNESADMLCTIKLWNFMGV